LAVALYAPAIGWGLPQATAPDRSWPFATDEILPLETLGEMHNTFVASKATRNYGYPWWHYFVASCAQIPYVGYLKLAGQMASPTPDYPYGFSDPVQALQVLTLIGRAVSVLMGAGVVIAAYYFSRALWGHMAGLLGAVLTMLNYLMFYYSRTGNVDMPAFFWTSIGLAIFARILVGGLTIRRSAWLGVFAGLAMATKDQAIIVFLPLACVLLVPRFAHSVDARCHVRSLLTGLFASVVAYVVATGMVVDPMRHVTHVRYMLFEPERLSCAAAYHPPHPRTWDGLVALAGDSVRCLADTMSWPVLVAALAGAVLLARAAPRRLVLLLPVAALLIMLVLPMGIVVRRYFLPLTLILDAFAAYAVLALRRCSWRSAWVGALVVLCGWRLLIGADLTYAQLNDSRSPASAWLRQYMEPGERIEYFGDAGQIPRLPAEIASRRIAGRADWHGEFGHGPALLRYLAHGPECIVVVPDWTSKPALGHSADCPAEVYAALTGGGAGYTLIAYFPTKSLLPASLQRPALDYPIVCPPVRIFARGALLSRVGLDGQEAQDKAGR